MTLKRSTRNMLSAAQRRKGADPGIRKNIANSLRLERAIAFRHKGKKGKTEVRRGYQRTGS